MKHILLAFFCLCVLYSAEAQRGPDLRELSGKMEKFYQLTGKRILILDKDVSQLNIPAEVQDLTRLPYLLVQNTPYSFFELKGNYLVIYPSFLKARYEAPKRVSQEKTIQRRYLIKGKIYDNEMKIYIPGALFSIPQLELASQTNDKGVFELEVPEGTYIGYFSSMGKETERKILRVYADQEIEVTLYESISELDLVTVSDRAIDFNVMGTLPGATRMPMEQLKLLPPLLGEVDVIKSIMLLPGVSTVGEGASGFNVRGGGVDQNLILMDEAPVFNPSHMFGFFSIFNQDAVKDAQLYKGDIPAEYGGRLSSVLDIRTLAGNPDNWSVGGGIGVLSSRLSANGPLGEKTQILATARMAYPNWILKRVPNETLKQSSTWFTDFNLRVDHRIDDNNSLVFSGYKSNDYFRVGADTAYSWQTDLASLRWLGNFGPNLGSELSLVYSGYRYSVLGEVFPVDFDLKSTIQYLSLKQKFELTKPDFPTLQFGYQINNYRMGMGDLIPNSNESLVTENTIPDERGWETSVFVQTAWKIGEKLAGQAGLRYSHYLFMGPKDVYLYQSGEPRSRETLMDTVSYASGKVIQDYGAWEPRFSFRYAFADDFSLKASVNRSVQYLQLLTNNFASAPVDLWKLSDSYVSPQKSWQYALGFYKNLKSNTIETSLEFYYKDMPSIVEYRDGAQLFLNPTLETDLVMGKGHAYGTEVLLRKNSGSINGWLSYTYSRSFRKVDDPEGFQINQGEFFPANWDQPHDLTLVSSYQPARRVSFNATFNYRTGRPITLPSGIYQIGGNVVIDYQERNQARIPDYHRLDLGLTYHLYQKKNSHYKSHITFSVYNVYARRNAFSWFFQPTPISGIPKSYRLAVIGTAIPSVTYNFSFK